MTKTTIRPLASMARPRPTAARLALGLLVLALVLPIAVRPAAGAETGAVEGRLTAGGEPVANATVTVAGPGIDGAPGAPVAVTDDQGRFRLDRLPAGEVELRFALEDHRATETGVRVPAGGVATVDRAVDWSLAFGETLTVTSASRRRQRIVDAPAAVTLVGEEEIGRRADGGRLPELLANAPGVEVTQGGLYDYNVNARGFNSTLSRRVLVLVDGRDPSVPFLASQEWTAFPHPLFDLQRMELVRGPASALYGTDAFNGVLDVTTKAPADSLGGEVHLTGGELDTRRVEARHALALGASTHLKLTGSAGRGDDFARSRVSAVEYPGLPTEAVPIPIDQVEILAGAVRLDHALGGDGPFADSLLTVEGGQSVSEGLLVVAATGRTQVRDSERPWARLNWTGRHWNLLAARTEREADNLAIATAEPSYLDSRRDQVELQFDLASRGGGVQLVGGASWQDLRVDSTDPIRGGQTLLFEPAQADRWGVFAQVDWAALERVRLVAAARWDEGDTFDARLSPKLALVWALAPGHTVRLSYDEAFQAPNFANYFLQVPVAPSVDLSAVEAAFGPLLGGVDLGLGAVPILALGNEDLAVEEIASVELGYSAILGRRALLNVALYRSEVENFATDLLPQVGTSLGRLNPSFGPYRPPAGLDPAVAEALLGTLAANLPPELFDALSNAPDGAPVFALLSFGNAGLVVNRGLEVALQALLGRRWSVQATGSLVDFEVREVARESPIEPNAPEAQASFALTWNGDRIDGDLRWRWVEGFFWQTGVFAGRVPSYTVVDLATSLSLTDDLDLGLEVSNLLDEEHFELFGGDLLGRRALVSLVYRW